MWFKVENLKFQSERKIEFMYNTYDAQQATINRSAQFQYVFTDVPKQVPASQIVIFDKALGLPQAYGQTSGSVGSRLSTTWEPESDLEIVDRLVSYTEGKEVIKVEPPPPNLRQRLKEIEIRERTDTVIRKISLKNLTEREMREVQIHLSENKEVRFDSTKTELFKKDPPEMIWKVIVPADGMASIEFTLKIHLIKTFEIEREPTPTKKNLDEDESPTPAPNKRARKSPNPPV
jgi:hypothetical protein